MKYVTAVEHAAGYTVPAIGPVALKSRPATAMPGEAAPPTVQSMETSDLSPSQRHDTQRQIRKIHERPEVPYIPRQQGVHTSRYGCG